ncbi:MAG: PEP/pyruvate-binding domain-containing protein [Candidatus Eisenbacteria bacterium]
MAGERKKDLPQYGRRFFGAAETFTRIGEGAIGGKAAGLRLIHDHILPAVEPDEFPSIEVVVPTLTVLTTNLYDAFVERNGLDPSSLAELPDDRIAHELQKADLPAEFVGDLWGIVDRVRAPLAVRSSSLLEDALQHPFAGVYATKMTPNNQPDVEARFRRLVEAIKFVYASTHFRAARSYLRSIRQPAGSEKMAVIVQEIVGTRWNDRFYPHVSGVARSYNYYPTGHGEPKDGVVSLALGLGKQIVDGGLSWNYAPPYPRAPAPFGGVRDLLRNTQSKFWAVHMGRPPMPDPIRETEYLVEADLEAAEADGTLGRLASTYDAASDRVRPGIGAKGPRVLDFAPLLASEDPPLNDLIRRLLSVAEEKSGAAVEIELALTLPGPGREKARLGVLQVRPMMVSEGDVDLAGADLDRPGTLLASEQALGNGVRDDIMDVVYLKPGAFEARHTPRIAEDLDAVNRSLLDENRPYLLIGFGRWGSSDPWLGVPVEWGQISGVRAIVEATLPDMTPDLSQGSHFFHNMIGFQVLYLSVGHTGPHRIDWEWLDRRKTVSETDFVRHVRLERPLRIEVDGRHARGWVRYDE